MNLQDAQTWRGMKMVDADGSKIGAIEDICSTVRPASRRGL